MTPFEMIKAHLSTAVPFATYTGVVIETVGDGTARASLPMRREVSNHFRRSASDLWRVIEALWCSLRK